MRTPMRLDIEMYSNIQIRLYIYLSFASSLRSQTQLITCAILKLSPVPSYLQLSVIRHNENK